MRLSLPWLVALAGLACDDDPPAPVESEPSVSAPEDPGAAASDGGEGEGELISAQPAWPAAPPRVRRLSHGEYNASVADLFAPQILPAQLFADDARLHDFDNQARALGPSPILIEQRRAAAAQIAAAVEVAPPTAAWLAELLGRAFRQPESDDDVQAFSELMVAAQEAAGDAAAGRAVISALLQAPRFVYRIDDGGGPAVASRLSYFLWGRPPDAELSRAAEAGELAVGAGVTSQIDRLLADPAAQARALEFHRQWLDLDSIRGVNKDAWAFPEYDQALKSAMREEADRFIADRIQGGGGHPQLLADPGGFVDARLASLYVADPPAEGDGWVATTHHPGERAGVLTQGWFLASRAHLTNPSPVLRGVFVLDRLLCRAPPPPGPDVDTAPPTEDEPDAAVTNRQRYSAHLEAPSCRGCHDEIDGIGFSFESYDAIGAYRLHDAGEAVDSTGWVTVDGERVAVGSAVELMRRLADSAEVDRCVARQWFRFGFGRDLSDADAAWFAASVQRWRVSGRSSLGWMRELALGLAMAK